MDPKRAEKPIKKFDFLDRKSPPIVVDHSLPAPSMVSSSCVSDVTPVDDDEKRETRRETRSQEEVSSPRSWLTLNLFPIRTCKNIQESFSFSVLNNSGVDLRRDIDPAPLRGSERETLESSTSDETPIIFAERERSSRRVVPNKNEQPVPRHKGEEKYYAVVSTELVLYEDPWKTRKKLTQSDLGHLSRLLLPQGSVKTHVLQWMGEEMVRQVKSRDGMDVVVRDADTSDEHRLVFRYWASSRSYLLNGDWNKLFVKGRGLRSGTRSGCSGTRSLASSLYDPSQGCSWSKQRGGLSFCWKVLAIGSCSLILISVCDR